MSGDGRLAPTSLASMVADLPCAVCGTQSAHVELVAPGDLPAGWADWDARRQEAYNRYHDPARWRFIYDGPAAGSGDGRNIEAAEAARITAAFTPPVRAARVPFPAGRAPVHNLLRRSSAPARGNRLRAARREQVCSR